MSTKPPHLDHESAFFRSRDAETAAALRRHGDLSPGAEYISIMVENQSVVVQSREKSAFRLPSGTHRFVGEEPTRILQGLLYEVWEHNERFVGESQIDAAVQLNGSPEQVDIIERGYAFAQDYVARRVPRTNNRDHGCPYRKFLRLYNELIPAIDQIGLIEGEGDEIKLVDVTGHFLAMMCDFMAWSFFEATWKDDVTWAAAGRVGFRRHPEIEPGLLEQCYTIFSIYRWQLAGAYDLLTTRLSRALVDECQPLPPGEEQARIELLADGLLQMKPFLVRNFRPSRAVVALPGDLVATFSWATNNRVGLLKCATSESKLVEQEQRGIVDLPLGISHQGLLTCFVNPWRTAGTAELDLPVPPLTVNRVVLEAVHDLLFGFYDQIDVEAILDRWRTTGEATEATVEEVDEVIAASITVDAQRGEEAVAAPTGRVTSSLRLSRLLSILEGRFGCTSRQGKGSELVLYREGSLQAVVGRHKTNPQLSAMGIRRILKKLGITVSEWLDATCS
jgi:hypothetical protein